MHGNKKNLYLCKIIKYAIEGIIKNLKYEENNRCKYRGPPFYT